MHHRTTVRRGDRQGPRSSIEESPWSRGAAKRRGCGKVAEPADKPGSVVDSHSSRRIVADTLEQPTRTRRGPRHEVPIWPCSRWGLPCRPVARLAVRSYRTISPLPRIPRDRSAVSFCCTFRRLAPPRRYLAPCPVEPGLSSALFPMTRLSGRLRRVHCRTAAAPAPSRMIRGMRAATCRAEASPARPTPSAPASPARRCPQPRLPHPMPRTLLPSRADRKALKAGGPRQPH